MFPCPFTCYQTLTSQQVYLLLLWSLQVIQYVDSLVPTVRRALIDPLPEVRVAAAKTFDQLHNTIGAKALDDILPDLLKKMVHVIN